MHFMFKVSGYGLWIVFRHGCTYSFVRQHSCCGSEIVFESCFIHETRLCTRSPNIHTHTTRTRRNISSNLDGCSTCGWQYTHTHTHTRQCSREHPRTSENMMHVQTIMFVHAPVFEHVENVLSYIHLILDRIFVDCFLMSTEI